MKILFCNYEYPPLGGGGGVVNAMLAEQLAKRHDVTVLTSRAFDLPAEDVVNGVAVVRVPVLMRRQLAAASFPSMMSYLPMGIRTGRRLLDERKFDIINTHFVLPSGPVGDSLGRYGRVPNVLSVHGGDLYDPSKFTSPHRHALLRFWIRRLLRRADQVVGQSRNTLENMRQYYAPEIDGVRIPLGINRPLESRVDREAAGFAHDDILLITVGRLVARKAVDQLIDTLSAIEDKNVHLIVIGTGPSQHSLENQARDLGLNKRVHFLGGVTEEEKFGLLRMSDVFVSTSQHEGFGLVFLEAMACGLPIVCYDYGGQTDFLQNQTSGFLVHVNDKERFTAACKELAGNQQVCKQMGTANLDTVEDFFIDRCAEQYEEVFERVLRR